MEFRIVNTEAAYRSLLAAPDKAMCEAIFREELVTPFDGLVKFFGGDGMAAFRQWGMSPDQFEDDKREQMAAIIDTLAAYDAWNKAALALEEGRAAFAKYLDRIPLDTVIFGLYVADMSSVPLLHFRRHTVGAKGRRARLRGLRCRVPPRANVLETDAEERRRGHLCSSARDHCRGAVLWQN